MKKTKTLGFLLGIAIMSTITGYMVFGWTEPTLAPPNGNISVETPSLDCVVVTNSVTIGTSFTSASVVAECPAGYLITGGGTSFTKSPWRADTNAGGDYPENNSWKWSCSYCVDMTVTVYASCCQIQ